MSRALQFNDEALEEIRSAASWYDAQREGLGSEFLDALDAQLEQLVHTPGLGGRFPGAPDDAAARRVLLARFPYVIVFVEVGEEIRVIAVMHGKRQPGYWMGRLAK